MGCGTSGQVVQPNQEEANGTTKASNGTKAVGNGHDKHDKHDDGLPTVTLPDTPVAAKSPVAFEIPLEEFNPNRRMSATPPPHLQRLLHPPQPEISLPDIEEKLAEAELRRQTILQQRAASAQKRTQKIMRNFQEMDKLDADREHEPMENNKHGVTPVTLPPEPGVCEDKTIR